MTNPDNIMGTNAAFSGRTPPNAFNDVLATFRSRGIVTGWECTPDSGLTLNLGGSLTARDVAIVEDNAGNRLTLNTRDNAKGVPISVTLSDADEDNPRIDTIVGYVNNPPEVIEDIPTEDNPTVCALLVVEGTPDAEPVAATDAEIRAAITADEGSGTTAYYVVLATVHVDAGATDITANDITAGALAVTETGFTVTDQIEEDSEEIPTSGAVYEQFQQRATTSQLGTVTVDNAMSSSSTNPVQNNIVNDRINETAVGTTETYTIDSTDWTALSGASPYTYSATVTATYTIGTNTVVRLLNDQPVLFANYGFAVASVSGQVLTIYALSEDSPDSSVALKVRYTEGA